MMADEARPGNAGMEGRGGTIRALPSVQFEAQVRGNGRHRNEARGDERGEKQNNRSQRELEWPYLTLSAQTEVARRRDGLGRAAASRLDSGGAEQRSAGLSLPAAARLGEPRAAKSGGGQSLVA